MDPPHIFFESTPDHLQQLIVAPSNPDLSTNVARIDKLPTEIKSEIFLWASYSDEDDLMLMKSDDPHLLVRTASLVCKHWRDVIRSLPFLWSHVHVVYNCDMSEKEKVAAWNFLGQCIYYSRNVPLYIKIDMPSPSDDPGELCIKDLTMNAHRWREFECNDEDLFNAIIVKVPMNASFDNLQAIEYHGTEKLQSLNPAPMLQTLTVYSRLHFDGHVTLQSSPCLTTVHLSYVRFPSTVFGGLSWSNLTMFISYGCEYESDELHNILKTMTNLEHLSLNGNTNTNITTKLPRLTSLSLSGVTECNALDILEAPQLKKLKLFQEFDPNTVVELIRRSGCSLEILLIEDAYIMEGWKTPEFSTIRNFFWKNPRGISEGIEFLTFPNSPGIPLIFPRLQYFEMTMIGFHADTADDHESVDIADELIKMLTSRLTVADRHPQPELPGRDDRPTAPRKLSGHAFITFAFDVDDDSMDKYDDFLYSELVLSSGAEITIIYDGQYVEDY